MEKTVVNVAFVRAASELQQTLSSGRLRVAMGDAQRVIHVVRGCFIGAESNLITDRLGELLIADGRLDPALLRPIAEEAKRNGLLFGDQLVIDGLLSPVELAAVLERQALARVERTLLMKGEVEAEQPVPVHPTARRPIAALIIELFRTRVPFEAAQALVLERLLQPAGKASGLNKIREARLVAAEQRIFKHLEGGGSAQSMLDQLEPDGEVWDTSLRFLGALEALGMLE